MLPPRGLARTPTFGCEFSCPSAPRHPFCPRAPPRSPPAAANSSNLAPHDKSSTDPDPAPAHAALSSAHTPRAPSCQRSDNASTALPRSPTHPAPPAPPPPPQAWTAGGWTAPSWCAAARLPVQLVRVAELCVYCTCVRVCACMYVCGERAVCARARVSTCAAAPRSPGSLRSGAGGRK